MKRTRRTLTAADRAAAAIFHEETLRHGLCQVCLDAPATEAHHVIAASRLRSLHLPVYDPRNGFPCCERCHSLQSTGTRPIPRRILRACNLEFAAEHDLTWAIERFYPEDVAA